MIQENNFKIIAYKDLKGMLPAGNNLEAVYEKSKDKVKFDETLFPVYEGDIETATLNLHNDIYWEVYYKYVNEREDLLLSQPVVLGNVHCEVLSFYQGLIAGEVAAKNMWTRYPDHKDSLAQITGSLKVEEVLFLEGKGLKKSTCLSVLGDAAIHTLINMHDAEVKGNKLSVQKEFSFPFIYATADRSKHAMKETDWSGHTLEELTTYFNKEVLDMEYGKAGSNPDMFFNVGTHLSKEYHNYLAKK
ncbi:hypothetical protein [Chitinophaga filiformis]|uniref:Uncharacterized protein n=1 Tax=Chitinophaga filiformis TaxID=104663 RepID=A0A1G8AZX6_CHIFI|nr:hypothetical protein [Chitinophaga filiformis]SDH26323.1 hypothetical protein SAMN04488121_11050 [Chitinophaga filiformis]